jgi:phosphoglycerate dehydrogenase-like enzyme
MVNLLLIIAQAEVIQKQYYDALRAKYPDFNIHLVDHHSKVGPYIADAEIVMTFGPMMADHVLADGKKIKWVHALTTGTDGIDNQPSLRPEIILTSTRGIHGAPVSEATILLMLGMARNVAETVHGQDASQWRRPMINLLDGKTAGILGVGLIGKHTARALHGLGMKVVGVVHHKPSSPSELQEFGIERVVTWEDRMQVVPDMDYVILLIPSRPDTRGMINAEFFAAMKPTARFINVGRGDVVDDNALIAALQANRIAGAGLDVFNPEPLPADSPYWKLPNVMITPHVGGFSNEYAVRALPIFYENVKQYLAGTPEKMINLVKH